VRTKGVPRGGWGEAFAPNAVDAKGNQIERCQRCDFLGHEGRRCPYVRRRNENEKKKETKKQERMEEEREGGRKKGRKGFTDEEKDLIKEMIDDAESPAEIAIIQACVERGEMPAVGGEEMEGMEDGEGDEGSGGGEGVEGSERPSWFFETSELKKHKASAQRRRSALSGEFICDVPECGYRVSVTVSTRAFLVHTCLALTNPLLRPLQTSRRTDLTKHIERRHAKAPPPFHCPILGCLYKSRSSADTRRHCIGHHKIEATTYDETLREKVSEEGGARLAEARHQADGGDDDERPLQTSRNQDLTKHMERRHAKAPPPFHCPLCLYKSRASADIKRHCIGHHKIEATTYDETLREKVSEEGGARLAEARRQADDGDDDDFKLGDLVSGDSIGDYLTPLG